MNEEQQASFNGWAKVEVMGHQSHVGYVRTEAYGAAVLFRVDTPELPEREYVLTEPSWVDVCDGGRQWIKAGAKVLRMASPGVSVLVGAGSIYRIIPCTEVVAMRAIEENARTPLKLVELPPALAIESASDDEDDGSQDDSDRCEGCNRPLELCDCPI